MSSYTALEGKSDFNATPISPPGCKIFIHEKPDARRTWAPHGSGRWYIGPALDHYRFHHVYVNATKS